MKENDLNDIKKTEENTDAQTPLLVSNSSVTVDSGLARKNTLASLQSALTENTSSSFVHPTSTKDAVNGNSPLSVPQQTDASTKDGGGGRVPLPTEGHENPKSTPQTPLDAVATKTASGSVVRPLRTFRTDIEKVVQEKKMSVVSAIAAESEKRSREKNTKKEARMSTKALLGVGGSILLLVLAVIILGGAVIWNANRAPIITTITSDQIPALIFVDGHEEYRMDTKSSATILRELAGVGQSIMGKLGSMIQIYPTVLIPKTDSSPEYKKLVTAPEFFDAIEAHITSSFRRSIEEDITMGFHIFDGNQPFIIIKTNFYENAFRGMIAWEKTMDIDLDPWFLPPQSRNAQLTQNTEATSTLTFSSVGFVDRLIKNKEVRIYPRQGTYGILYGFIDRETLVITTNEFTFAEIVRRFQSTR